MDFFRKSVMIKLVLLVGVAWSVGNLWAAEGQKVGTIAAIRGEVEILHPGARAFRAAKLYEDVLVKDRIRTGPGGRVKILYDDDSLTILSEKSSIEIEEYELSQKKERKQSLIGLLRGKLRFIVTKYLVKRKANFFVQTPTAVVGVRGSDSVAVLDDDDTTTAYHLSGDLEVTNRITGVISFIISMEYIKIFPDGRQEKGTITPEQMEQLLGYFAGAFPTPRAVREQLLRIEQELRQEDIDTILTAPEREAERIRDELRRREKKVYEPSR
jgi:hypothetical protein